MLAAMFISPPPFDEQGDPIVVDWYCPVCGAHRPRVRRPGGGTTCSGNPVVPTAGRSLPWTPMRDDATDGWFPESVAAAYDDDPQAVNDPGEIARTVDVLASLAGIGPVLEFAVGTGRIACPLSERGVAVRGIELSRAMAARIPAKPGGELIEVTIGDMCTTRVDGEFTLVYLVYNTIGNVLTQNAQVEVFANAARHLAPGGRFLVEVGVPDLRRLPPGQDTVPFAVDVASGYIGFDQYDVVTQQAFSHHVTVRDGAASFTPFPWRYVWPAELDLMARLAGLALTERWADWSRAPFTADSTKHVSVWTKPT